MTIQDRALVSVAQLNPLFEDAFAAFLNEERDNLLAGISEQNLCGRLAMCVERRREAYGFSDYCVDTEYNRNGGKLKTIIDEHTQIVTIRCDIILHSRGRVPSQDNLIVIEMKRSSHRRTEKEKDRTRLRAMTKVSYDGIWSADGRTLPEHVCGYVVGYYLEINADARTALVEIYEDGALTEFRQEQF